MSWLGCGAISVACFALLIGLHPIGFYSWLGVYTLLNNLDHPQSFMGSSAHQGCKYLNGAFPVGVQGIKSGFSFGSLDLLELHGQSAVVTGANSGVGYQTALHLARRGAHVFLACRSVSKCEAAAAAIGKNTTAGKASPMTLDTSSLKSVRRFADAVKSQTDSLDMLVLNAGSPASGMPFELSEDGIEKVFATNYLGHFLLYKLLLPLMETGGKSGVARVVAVSSRGHADSYPWGVAVSLEQLNDRSSWQAGFSGAYPQSKLAQIYFVQEAARRMGQKPVYVNAADPGGVATAAWDGIPDTAIAKAVGAVSKLLGAGDFLFSPDDGALPQLYLAAAGEDLATKNIRGRYFTQPVQESQPCLAGNLTLQEALWDFSEKLVEI